MLPAGTHILCCDWGTSALRLQLVDSRDSSVRAGIRVDAGIRDTYSQWKALGTAESRKDFYLRRLGEHTRQLGEDCGIVVAGLPLVVSGMASSSIGIEELRYAPLPFAADGSDAVVKIFDESLMSGEHRVFLVSGVRSDNDVMRGEEVQLMGLQKTHVADVISDKGIFIFPGTHSKHIQVEKNAITDFGTYMTGEMFHLLGSQSVLSESVYAPGDNGMEIPEYKKAFIAGLHTAGRRPFLNALFTVRTNALFQKMSAEENFWYLSGLVIGTELAGLRRHEGWPVIVSAAGNLACQYRAAFEEAAIRNAEFMSSAAAEKASIAGQIEIFRMNSTKRTA